MPSKSKRKTHKKTGRPLTKIDPKQVLKLAEFHCTYAEIGAFFDVDESTIRKRFSDIVEKGKETGKRRLRIKQIQVAMKGNVSMLIWLGKQMLDQSDKQDIEHSGAVRTLPELMEDIVNGKKDKKS